MLPPAMRLSDEIKSYYEHHSYLVMTDYHLYSI